MDNHKGFRLIILLIWGIVPFILLIFAGVGALFFYREVNFSSLQYSHPISQIQFPEKNEVVPGETIHGEFIARDDNLGALGIKVNTFNRLNNSVVAFQLREKGKDDWYCYNTYFTDRWANGELYPFGFPKIGDSRGKIYEFEILGGTGDTGNAIGIEKDAKFFVSRYTFDRQEILSDMSHLRLFLQKKAVNLFSKSGFLLFVGMFLAPLVVYIFILMNRRKAEKDRNARVLGHLVILYDLAIYMISPVLMKSDVVLYIALLILVTSIIFKISFRRIFSIALIMIILCPVWLYIQQEEIANRSAALVFFLMIDGLILMVKDLYFPKRFFIHRKRRI